MKTISSLLFLLLSLSVFAETIDSRSYRFPSTDYSRATLTAGAIRDHDGFVYTIVKFRSEQNKGRRLSSLKVRIYESQTPSDSLVFVMTGIGGRADSGGSNFLASELTKNGHHAAIIPSTFTEEFAKSYSNNGYAGLLNKDAFDLLELMNQVKAYVENRNIKINSLKMVGYSLGALTAAHVSEQSYINKKEDIHFDKVMMINPPVDLIYGLRFLDTALKYRSHMGMRHYLKVGISLLRTLKNAMGMPMTVETYKNTLNRMSYITKQEADFYIATSLSSSLAGVIEASQDTVDLDILPPKPTSGSVMEQQERSERTSAISNISFETYIDTFVVRFYREHNPDDEQYRAYTLDALNKRVSMYAVAEHIKRNPNIFLSTNTDDFLLRGDADVKYLSSLFGDRATFYPRGGHIGNMWFKDNMDRVLKVLK